MNDYQFEINLSSTKKQKPAFDQLVFGRNFTDHMFVMDYTEGRGWHDPRIIPYQPLQLDPSAMVFHYGQSVFEGLKAYLTEDQEVLMFRPYKNMERLNRSNNRLCIPAIDEELAVQALRQLISVDHDWVPNEEGTSLYIRPFIISTEPYLGVAASHQYQFIIIMSPVGAYYKEGINPVKIAVQSEYVRAVKGGTGNAKTGGNYASSLKAQEVAEKSGYSQVLWLDGKENKYVEEVGSMNIFFKINGEIVTPELNGSILEGVTRNSVIELIKHWEIPLSERKVSIDEIYEAHKNGQLEEAFGTGTAAVISPIGEFFWNDEKLVINNGETGEISRKLYDTLTGIQKGKLEDKFGWIVKVDEEKAVTSAI
ncbi:branched-chain amino acid aminotransferase [Cytobacillus horneckiae]|uniref:Branched-chain-amino-acid aminotransferase n=1 Tax=Cytobacillus horneckiae TaxID=549687 RepID=A0A2N0ZDZ4_9BACI|nr:branched-chain amino acid aminotransferase [Cytobacillus horneckiae]NRG47248.1 branched-chain amino acid aminotransferase [Bacillus sp. CRN 9]MBN6886826.1 branched-chain amino acid aminotransferase [Cytobacillus horneckiae]MCM3177703.1 branched-chain amino acid aminotransferase [Cytobacillus horneckiae]MEC1158018.1 branched-chain amino acid aminotransferase [Cytobacillus horneckiae]MED2937057.1 branched-chain amino acid aminotransferase [Cytobacillus horneckiae]